jgi:hypothetical protein
MPHLSVQVANLSKMEVSTKPLSDPVSTASYSVSKLAQILQPEPFSVGSAANPSSVLPKLVTIVILFRGTTCFNLVEA